MYMYVCMYVCTHPIFGGIFGLSGMLRVVEWMLWCDFCMNQPKNGWNERPMDSFTFTYILVIKKYIIYIKPCACSKNCYIFITFFGGYCNLEGNPFFYSSFFGFGTKLCKMVMSSPSPLKSIIALTFVFGLPCTVSSRPMWSWYMYVWLDPRENRPIQSHSGVDGGHDIHRHV